MRKCALVFIFLAICSLVHAQQALDNNAIARLVKAGLSEDLIVSTINAKPGNYDTSAAALTALKTDGASGKVIAAIVLKSARPVQAAPVVAPPAPLPTPPPALPAPATQTEPKLQMSFCAFHLNGTNSTGQIHEFDPGGGVIADLGTVGSIAAWDRAVTYFQQITPEVERRYGQEIEQRSHYRMVASDGLVGPVDSATGKHLSLAEMAERNHLFACVSASPTWVNKMGWEKSLVITTKWEVEQAPNCWPTTTWKWIFARRQPAPSCRNSIRPAPRSCGRPSPRARDQFTSIACPAFIPVCSGRNAVKYAGTTRAYQGSFSVGAPTSPRSMRLYQKHARQLALAGMAFAVHGAQVEELIDERIALALLCENAFERHGKLAQPRRPPRPGFLILV